MAMVFGCTVALFLPTFTWTGAAELRSHLMARGESSPILLGRKGDDFDLTMGALYFRGHVRDPIPMSAKLEASQSGYGTAIPIYAGHSVSGAPLVGTSLSYFSARGLSFSGGRAFAVLGEVVAGSAAAADFNLSPGDTVRSDMQNLYNIAGSYPMILKVTGVLGPSGTPDDGAFFTDVKTAWAIDGHLHGHDAVGRDSSLNPEAAEGENLEATAAIFMFPEITEENRNSFHMHGDMGDLPLTAVLVLPSDQRAHDQLLGDYALSETIQAVRPEEVVASILEILLGLQKAMGGYFIAVAVSTLAFFGLSLNLSLRLRQEELRLMERIGGSRRVISLMVAAEVGVIAAVSIVLSGLLSLAALWGLRLLLH
jgi:putative ABC transport system permease protein